MNADNSACFSTGSDEWETPLWLFNALNQEFGFDCDAAAKPNNAKCQRFLTDALNVDWVQYDPILRRNIWTIFCNPPYSLAGEFMKKAKEESRAGATCVMLIANRSSNTWYHDYVITGAAEVRMIESRVAFKGTIKKKGQPKDLPKEQTEYVIGSASAPFPSIVVVYRPGVDTPTWSSWRVADQARA